MSADGGHSTDDTWGGSDRIPVLVEIKDPGNIDLRMIDSSCYQKAIKPSHQQFIRLFVGS